MFVWYGWYITGYDQIFGLVVTRVGAGWLGIQYRVSCIKILPGGVWACAVKFWAQLVEWLVVEVDRSVGRGLLIFPFIPCTPHTGTLPTWRTVLAPAPQPLRFKVSPFACMMSGGWRSSSYACMGDVVGCLCGVGMVRWVMMGYIEIFVVIVTRVGASWSWAGLA